MDKIIALVVSIVIVLGLIAFAVMPQVIGVREAGDTALSEQAKMNEVLGDSSRVTGSTVKRYLNSRDGKTTVSGAVFKVTVNPNTLDASNIADNAVFKETREYDPNGIFVGIDFTQIDMGNQ
ncbi:MAG TPA: hypothetical protein VFD57_02925 [Clostridia bacterium]|nr:hypothetical protein [Clostridia bacterium]